MADKIFVCIYFCVILQVASAHIQSSQNNTCPYEWGMFEGTCYLFKINNIPWITAMHECREAGGVLAMIDTYEKLDYLSRMLRIMSWNNAVYEYWFGLTDEVYEGKWRWVKTGTNAIQTFWNTLDGTHYANDNCAYIGFKNYTALWYRGTCTTRKYYICEKSLGSFFTPFG